MTQFYHSNCGGAILAGMRIDLSVISFSFRDKSLAAGAVDAVPRIDNKAIKAGEDFPASFFCKKCQKTFDTEEDFKEITASCFYCGCQHPIESMLVTAYTAAAGKECLEKFIVESGGYIAPTCRKYSLLTILSQKKIAG